MKLSSEQIALHTGINQLRFKQKEYNLFSEQMIINAWNCYDIKDIYTNCQDIGSATAKNCLSLKSLLLSKLKNIPTLHKFK